MSLAIELPDEQEPSVESGERTATFQIRDKIVVGDIITIISGGTKRKARITNKVWVPEVEMADEIRQGFAEKIPKEVGFSGAFKVSFQYTDTGEPEEDIDVISKHMD